MKKKYIIGGIVIIFFLIIAVFSLMNTDVEYADFSKAKEKSGRKVQVKGQWTREKGSTYDSGKNEFLFFMKDEKGDEKEVVFKGIKPNNFEIASHIIATGKYENDKFIASEILTKCPSKYEGQKYTPTK
jgi:cytochrome c-type biogenesis protein CcmE